MSLILKIEEQSFYAFTGRINLLLPGGQLLGTILQKDGLLVNATYRGANGRNALYALVINEQFSEKKITLVIEPEIILQEQILFKLPFAQFKKLSEKLAEKYYPFHRLRPPASLRLFASNQNSSLELDNVEAEILRILSSPKSVSEIYSQVISDEIETTIALVNLRKNG